MAHHHFTRDDRVFLAKLIKDGLGVRATARILGFHPSSVYRELARGRVVPATPHGTTTACVLRARKQGHDGQLPTNNTASLERLKQQSSSDSFVSTTAPIKLDRLLGYPIVLCTVGYGAFRKKHFVEYGSISVTPSYVVGMAPSDVRDSENLPRSDGSMSDQPPRTNALCMVTGREILSEAKGIVATW